MAKQAFTLIELLVVIAIIAILAAILFPVFAHAKASARATVCLSNCRQVGIAMRLYCDDNNQTYPLDSHVGINNSWITQIQPYVKSRLLTRCPDDASVNFEHPLPTATKTRLTSFGVNYWFSQQNPNDPSPLRGYVTEGQINSPAGTIYMAELATNLVSEHFHPPLWYPDNEEGVVLDPKRELAITIHRRRSNYLFADGHATTLAFEQTFSGNGLLDRYDPRR